MSSADWTERSDLTWLREQLRLNRVTQRELARISGIDATLVSRGLAGKRPMHRADFQRLVWGLESILPSATMTAFQQAAWQSRVPLEKLAERSGLQADAVERLIVGKPVALDGRDFEALRQTLGHTRKRGGEEEEIPEGYLPVLAPPKTMEDGRYRSPEVTLQYRRRPEALARAPEAYALFVGDDTWEPRWQAGELLFVHPGRPVPTGAWVVLDLVDGELVCGRVVRNTADTIVMHSPGGVERRVAKNLLRRSGMVVGTWCD